MKALAITLGIASLAVAGLVQAQSTSSGTGITWPHQRGFWGHAGASFGRSELDAACPAGFTCDTKDQAYRVFAGGKFNNTFGAEIAWVNLGEWARGGGDTDAQSLDIALLAGVPLGRNTSIFGKLGTAYTRAEVAGTAAPGFQTGKEDGWDVRYGLGIQIGLTENWAIRGDWDRYRVKFPGTKEDIDTLMIGAQYSFR